MPYKTTVYEGNIVQLIQRGSGNRWIRRKANAIKDTAVILAPVRTMALKRSHKVTQNRNLLGQYQSGFIVSADAGHAAAVHGGTVGPIHARNGRYLRIPGDNPRRYVRNPRHGRNEPTTVVRSVRGQRANPWLLRAARMHR